MPSLYKTFGVSGITGAGAVVGAGVGVTVTSGAGVTFTAACSRAFCTALRIPFEENVALTKQVVEYAHAHGVTVEAEIGHVGTGETYGSENNDSVYTEVDMAVKFVELTNVDSLAVSIGTAHGKYKGTPVINFERLHQLREAVKVPLVLHGGSGSGEDNLRRCSTEGISKINIFTDFISAASDAVAANENIKNWFDLLHTADEGIKKTLRYYYNLFDVNK